MIMYLKLGTLPMKRYETRDYKSIDVGDKIEIRIGGVGAKWAVVKITKIYDDIPVKYFGGYV